MGVGPGGKDMQRGRATVTLSSGGGTTAITYAPAFTRKPQVMVVAHEADVANGASYTAASELNTGFTLTVAASDYPNGDIEVSWVAHEKD